MTAFFWDQLKISCFDNKSGALGPVADSHRDVTEFMFEDQYCRDTELLNDYEFIGKLL